MRGDPLHLSADREVAPTDAERAKRAAQRRRGAQDGAAPRSLNPALRASLMTYRPAMEFAGPVDLQHDVSTWRPIEKWKGRVKVGDLIEIERVHQRKPGRFLARVINVDDQRAPEAEIRRLALIYPSLPYPGAFLRIVLRLEPGATRDDPRFVTWETKTTRLARRA